MTNIKKIGLSALAGSLVALSAANAGEMAVSGSASLTIGNSDEGKNGTYHTMSDSINFSGSGELDNGMTISMAVEFDGDEGDAGEGLDSHSLTLDTNGMGVIKFVGHGGAGVLDAWDDMMPTAYEEPWDAVSGADSSRINGAGDNDAFGYTSPTFNGVTFQASYSAGNTGTAANGTNSQVNVYTDWGVKYTGIEGLTVGYAEGTTDESNTSRVENDESTIFVTYAFGPVTVGAQRSDFDSTTNANDKESEGYGISYAVNDDLSISYGVHTIDFDNAKSGGNSDQESSAIGFSYTMGSISFGGTMNDVDNVAGAAATDREGYEFNLAFAF